MAKIGGPRVFYKGEEMNEAWWLKKQEEVKALFKDHVLEEVFIIPEVNEECLLSLRTINNPLKVTIETITQLANIFNTKFILIGNINHEQTFPYCPIAKNNPNDIYFNSTFQINPWDIRYATEKQKSMTGDSAENCYKPPA